MTILTIRVPDELAERVKATSEKLGVKQSVLLREAVEGFFSLSDITQEKVSDLASRVGLPRATVIDNLLVSFFAEQQAKEEVWTGKTEVLPQFTMTTEGAVRGEQLFELLREHFVEPFKRLKYADEYYRDHVKAAKNVAEHGVLDGRPTTPEEVEDFLSPAAVRASSGPTRNPDGTIDLTKYEKGVSKEAQEEWERSPEWQETRAAAEHGMSVGDPEWASLREKIGWQPTESKEADDADGD